MSENMDKSYLRALLEEIDSGKIVLVEHDLDDDDAGDASLLALAEERMNGYDPSKVITQAEIDTEFGFEKK